jgi:hypothetical protein
MISKTSCARPARRPAKSDNISNLVLDVFGSKAAVLRRHDARLISPTSSAALLSLTSNAIEQTIDGAASVVRQPAGT